MFPKSSLLHLKEHLLGPRNHLSRGKAAHNALPASLSEYLPLRCCPIQHALPGYRQRRRITGANHLS